MGCDYYIYTVLKILHTNGTSLIKLHEKQKYIYHTDDDEDNFTIHPSLRRQKIDYMIPTCEDVLIYKKGDTFSRDPYITEYMELIKEFIKLKDEDYVTTNKILINNTFFNYDRNEENLISIDDINEIYIVELREWRN